jgi:hypothetical protein
MFKRRTLFVLGAGASAEVKMPLGAELDRTIGRKCDIRYERGLPAPIGGPDRGRSTAHRTSHKGRQRAGIVSQRRRRDRYGFDRDSLLHCHLICLNMTVRTKG